MINGAPTGNYSVNYRICNINNPFQCSSSTVTFVVNPPALTAINDNYTSTPINGCNGGTTASVLINDLICTTAIGSTPVIVSLINPVPIVGATINNSGIINIPANTPVGTYTFNYKFCQQSNTSNCSNNGSISISVTNSSLIANNDDFTSTNINSPTGGVTPNILANDTFNGSTINSSSISVALVTSNPNINNLTLNTSTGQITIPPGVTNGIYNITYSLTQNSCNTNIITAIVTININDNITTPPISPGIRADNVVTYLDTQSDNKIFISGYFYKYNNTNVTRIIRLNTDLTLDTTTNIPQSATSLNYSFDFKVIKNNNGNFDKVLLSLRNAPTFNGISVSRGIVRLMQNGSIDNTFNPYSGPNRGASGSNSEIRALYIYPDNALNGNAGKILIGGMFAYYNNTARGKIARLMPDGSIDPTFDPNISTAIDKGLNSTPESITVDIDGKILVGGNFNQFNDEWSYFVIRLNNNGTRDYSFNHNQQGIDIDGGVVVDKVALQPDGKIILGGYFSKYNGVTRHNLLRLMPNGLLDTTFGNTLGFFPYFISNVDSNKFIDRDKIRSLLFEQDPADATKYLLYVSGGFTKLNNVDVQKVVRFKYGLNDTSSGIYKDSQFNMGNTSSTGGPNDIVWCMKKQGSKILLGGAFTQYTGPTGISSALRVTRIQPSSTSIEAKNSSLVYENEPEINIFTDDEFIIYPNPATDALNIQFENDKIEKYYYEIINSIGQKVLSNFNIKDTSIDVTSLTIGLYFLKIISSEKVFQKSLLIK